MQPSWRNGKHAAQWKMTLQKYAVSLRKLPANEIGTEDVLAVLKPIWNGKSETASRLRGRIERILDAAKAHGLRSGENPARWRGHLDQLLPKRQRLARGHHAAAQIEDARHLGRRERHPRQAIRHEHVLHARDRQPEQLVAGRVHRTERVALYP